MQLVPSFDSANPGGYIYIYIYIYVDIINTNVSLYNLMRDANKQEQQTNTSGGSIIITLSRIQMTIASDNIEILFYAI